MENTMKKTLLLIATGSLLVSATGCTSSGEISKGAKWAAVGTAVGTIVGGVIGHQSGHKGTGALIGAAVGGLGAFGAAEYTENKKEKKHHSDKEELIPEDEIKDLKTEQDLKPAE